MKQVIYEASFFLMLLINGGRIPDGPKVAKLLGG